MCMRPPFYSIISISPNYHLTVDYQKYWEASRSVRVKGTAVSISLVFVARSVHSNWKVVV